MWAETRVIISILHLDAFQSTPPVWAETNITLIYFMPARISIHSARVGGDLKLFFVFLQHGAFQSTPPVWAETKSQRTQRTALIYFNPLRPCGRSLHSSPRRKDSGCNFNPLRPCGRRLQIAFSFPAGTGFQSTPPVWAETVRQVYTEVFKSISIHSARVGGDSTVRAI